MLSWTGLQAKTVERSGERWELQFQGPVPFLIFVPLGTESQRVVVEIYPCEMEWNPTRERVTS